LTTTASFSLVDPVSKMFSDFLLNYYNCTLFMRGFQIYIFKSAAEGDMENHNLFYLQLYVMLIDHPNSYLVFCCEQCVFHLFGPMSSISGNIVISRIFCFSNMKISSG
jgi:hypothetical protein